MRLLTHNQLVCVRKGCASHYPLQLTATKVERTASGGGGGGNMQDGEDEADADEVEEEDDPEEAAAKLDFVLHLLPNVDYAVLLAAATALGLSNLPASLPDVSTLTKEKDGPLLQSLHAALVDTHVQEGSLRCDKCGRAYPIQQGIPNMRLNEDEVQ